MSQILRQAPGLRSKLERALLPLAALLALGACAQLGTKPPGGFDLSGDWVLDEQASDAAPDIAAIREREDRQLVRGKPASAGESAAFLVQDFPVLAATRLRIEQHADSMGVRYDDGGYRDVSWGDRTRDLWTVRAGWTERGLVIRSARGAIRGEEILALEDGGRRLRIAVSVRAGEQRVDTTRVYRRR